MNAMLWALAGWPTPENLGQQVVNVLAVAGGVLIGGYGCGVLVKLLVRALAASKVPPRVLQVVRVLGAILGGWLVALLVFGSGSGQLGLGFGGGPGSGSGPGGTGRDSGPPATQQEKKGVGETHHEQPAVPARNTLRVEVLGKADGQYITDGQVYRVEGQSERHSLADMEEIIDQRMKQAPPLQKVEIVIYRDSPQEETALVKDLWRLARGKNLVVGVDSIPNKAPA